MKNKLISKGLVFAIILITTTSAIPMTSSETENYVSPKTTMDVGDNVLARIYVNYSGGMFGALKPCETHIEFTHDEVFYFPEYTENRSKVNFTIYCCHRFQTSPLFPFRITHVEFAIWDVVNDTYIYQKNFYQFDPPYKTCTGTEWDCWNFSIDQYLLSTDVGWKYSDIDVSSRFKAGVSVFVSCFPPLRGLKGKGEIWNIYIDKEIS